MGCGSSVPSKQKPLDKPALPHETWQRRQAEEKLARAMENEVSRKRMQALYTEIDVDGDGKITPEEWSAGLESHKELMAEYFGDTTQESNRATFKSLDEDGNGSLSWEEFCTGVDKLRSNLTQAFS